MVPQRWKELLTVMSIGDCKFGAGPQEIEQGTPQTIYELSRTPEGLIEGATWSYDFNTSSYSPTPDALALPPTPERDIVPVYLCETKEYLGCPLLAAQGYRLPSTAPMPSRALQRKLPLPFKVDMLAPLQHNGRFGLRTLLCGPRSLKFFSPKGYQLNPETSSSESSSAPSKSTLG